MPDSKKVSETSSGEVVNGLPSCRDLSDAVPLYSARGIYLKPIAKINVSINLPQLKTPGKTISTWEVTEKIRLLIRPDEFVSLKVVKSSLEFIRFEGDLGDRSRLQRVLARLDGQRLNLAGFPNVLKVKAAEMKVDFPTRHSWDSYFRDAKHMNELKAGERPDTIHISGLPVKWFSEDDGKTPSEPLVAKIFKRWGVIKRVDVPAADPYRSRMRLGANIQKFSYEDGIFFDAFIQYVEYMDFVKAMDAMRGMKLLKKEKEKNHLVACLKKEEYTLKEKDSRRRAREEKRKRKALTVFRKHEEDIVTMKIAREERKLIKAQRQLESIRLLDALFDRIKKSSDAESEESDLDKTKNATQLGGPFKGAFLPFGPEYHKKAPIWLNSFPMPLLDAPRRGFPRNRFRGGNAGNYPRGLPYGARGLGHLNPQEYNDMYYDYFTSLVGQDNGKPMQSRSRSRGRRPSRSRSNNRRTSRSRSNTRRMSRSRRRRDSRSNSKRRSRSKSKKRSRSKSRSRSRSRRRSRSRSRGRRSSRNRSRPRQPPRRRRSLSGGGLGGPRRSESRVRVTRARSRSPPARRSRSSSWSLPKTPERRRSCSWAKTAEEPQQQATKTDTAADKVAVSQPAEDSNKTELAIENKNLMSFLDPKSESSTKWV
ncbi:hypothetical protein QAD02_022474 [Eretmocerus hayati]|uniref:Uncharacterized protein n=1 Tax=Eretmocerus hayati TaxID=131215 RepID=A0ACC2PSW6_9HYME|nr:hypothetical protein QAD02_022474 [Eretmocerus hayati]